MNILDLMENNDIVNKINKYTTEIKRNKKKFKDVIWDIKMLNYINDGYFTIREYYDINYENEDEYLEFMIMYPHIFNKTNNIQIIIKNLQESRNYELENDCFKEEIKYEKEELLIDLINQS